MYIFANVIKELCKCNQDPTGEYNSQFKIHFILSQEITFSVLETDYTIDRIIMRNGCDGWSEEPELVFANDKVVFPNINIPKNYQRAFYRRLLKEQKKGVLKGWCFDEDIAELYRGEN